MRANATDLWIILVIAAAAVATGIALLRTRARGLGWLALAGGMATAALLALAQFTGRLGPEYLWFRSPTFYGALAMSIAGATWWLRRPAPPALRFGLPALTLGLLGMAALLVRSDGRSSPLAMLMPTLGKPAPELSYYDDLGAKRELAELRGRVVLLNFWATWCAPCRHEMPMLSKLQREYADQGLVVLYVSLEEPEVLTPFLAAEPLRWHPGPARLRRGFLRRRQILSSELPDLARRPGRTTLERPAHRGLARRARARPALRPQALTLMTCARIFPSIAAPPKRPASAICAASVAAFRRAGSRDSISLRIGVPWQKATAGMRADAARLRAATA